MLFHVKSNLLTKNLLAKSIPTVLIATTPFILKSAFQYHPQFSASSVSQSKLFTYFSRFLHTQSTAAAQLSMSADKYTVIADSQSIETPLLDDRSYRFIKLNHNNLHVLVINDPTADKSAAALDVNVGSFADKKYQVSGLAHFCEHLLFMGTEKYPEENEYSSYLSKHSGYSNAYTAAEHTNYYFEVSSNYLEGALDRFAQFFISPLFSKSCKDREIKAVDSENKKNLQNDLWRFYQLDKSTSNPDHPFSGFSTGNFETLHEDPVNRNLNVRDVLLDFYHKEYSSNIMSLVVLGKEDLDQLTLWAIEKFNDVPNVDLARPSYNGELLYQQDQLGQLIRAKPIKDSHKVELSFLVPDDQEKNWASKPSSYYSHLIGHESKGSLLHYLKDKNLVNELSAGGMKVCQGTSLFMIEFDLTEQGLANWQSILGNVFEYLKLVLDDEPQHWIWKEISDMSKVNFKFTQKRGASSTVSKISNHLYQFTQDAYIPAQYLLSSSISREFNSEEIKDYGKFLNPKNMRVFLSSQKLDDLNLKEKWYGTEYSTEPIDQNLIEQWERAKLNPNFHYPVPNKFIPSDFSISGTKSDSPLLHPYLLKDNNKAQVWYKQDDRFEIPKGAINILLHLPTTFESLKSSIYTTLLAGLIDDELNDLAYYASLVGLSFNLHHSRGGLLLEFSGYNDKVPVLLEHVLQTVKTFVPRKDRYETIKAKVTQDIKNSGFEVPYYQVGKYLVRLINEKTYPHEDKLKLLQSNDLTFEELSQFSSDLWSQGVFADILIHGNFDHSRSSSISSLILKHLQSVKPIAESTDDVKNVIQHRSHFVPANERARYEVALQDPSNINSCIEYFIQIEESQSNERLRVLADLLSTTIHEACFNQLRTKEQLGYVVFSGVRLTRTRFGFRILVQSERSTAYLEYRIEEFLHKFRTQFIEKNLSDEVFDKFKQALKDKKLTKLKNLSEEVNRFWLAITDGYYDFNERSKHVEILEDITKDEFVKFYDDYIDYKNPASKAGRLSIHVKSQCTPVLTHAKALSSAVNNFIYHADLTIESDKVDSILQKDGAVLSQIVNDITEELLKDDVSAKVIGSDVSQFKTRFNKYVEDSLVSPTPTEYPKGQLFSTVKEFRERYDLGGHPEPVEPLSNFHFPNDHAHL